ncbi:MAG: ABC transporter ATP-binding protein [Candidatus Gracilibacteria bacterium]
MKTVSTRQIFRFMWKYFRRFPWLVTGSYFFTTLSYVADLANPWLMGQIVGTIQNEQIPTDLRFQQAMFWITLMALQGIVFHVSYRITHFFNCHLDSRVEALIASETLDRVQRFSTDWHNNSFAGSTVTKIKRGTRAAHVSYDIICYDLYPALGVVIGLVVMTTLKNALLGMIFGGFAVVYVTISVLLALYYVAPQRRKANRADNKVGATLADAISCNATVKSFGGEKREMEFFYEVITNWRHTARKAWIRSNIVAVIQNVLIMALKFMLFSGAVWLWYQGKLTLADFVFVLSTYLVFTGYFRPIGDRIRDLQEAFSDIEDTVNFHHHTDRGAGCGARPGITDNERENGGEEYRFPLPIPSRQHLGEFQSRDRARGENCPGRTQRQRKINTRETDSASLRRAAGKHPYGCSRILPK